MFKMFVLLLIGLMALSPALVFAQNDIAETAAGAGGGFLIFVVLGLIALNIALLVWVYRDAQNRGMEYAIGWLIIVLVFGPLAAIVYLFAREKGILVPCSRCGAKRLAVSAKCPHCGNA